MTYTKTKITNTNVREPSPFFKTFEKQIHTNQLIKVPG